MPSHDYTPRAALDLLVMSIGRVSTPLAQRIRLAIDAGKDIQAEEVVRPATRKRKAKKRYYRKHVPYEDEEALSVAMTVLESHLVESRMLVNAARDEFTKIGLTTPKKIVRPAEPGAPLQATLELDVELSDEVAEVLALGEPKDMAIESEPEAVLEKRNLPDLRLQSTNEQQLKSLREVFQRLRILTDFRETAHGNSR